MTTATLHARLDASAFNLSAVNPAPFNPAPFDPLLITWPMRERVRKPKGLDKKRIGAIAAVVCAHVLVFGAMLLPPGPSAPAMQSPSDPVQLVLEHEVKVPPPLPPQPVQIIREIKPPDPNTAPVRTSTPVISQPALAVTAAPTEEFGTKIEAPISTSAAAPPSPASEALSLVSAPPPRYPPVELKRGVQGTVHFKVRVGVDGLVKEIAIIKSSGSRILDRAAIAQIKRRWVFEPRLHDGQKIESTGIGQVSFSLR